MMKDRRRVRYLLVTLLTVVCVGSLQQVSFDVLLHRVQQVLVVPDVHVQRGEGLLTLIPGNKMVEQFHLLDFRPVITENYVVPFCVTNHVSIHISESSHTVYIHTLKNICFDHDS